MNVAVLDNARQILRRVRESETTLVRGPGLTKAGQLPQYETVPQSSLTAVSDFIANRRYAPKVPNPLTSDEQALLQRLLGNMDPSRARVVDAHRRARTSAVRLKQMLTSSGLWG